MKTVSIGFFSGTHILCSVMTCLMFSHGNHIFRAVNVGGFYLHEIRAFGHQFCYSRENPESLTHILKRSEIISRLLTKISSILSIFLCRCRWLACVTRYDLEYGSPVKLIFRVNFSNLTEETKLKLGE